MLELIKQNFDLESPEDKRPQIIYVDGQPGSDKSTLCELIAKREGYKTLTTGQIFCALAYAVRATGIDISDTASVEQAVKSTKLGFDISTLGSPGTSVNGIDLTGRTFTRENKRFAAVVSSNPEARIKIAKELRQLVSDGNWVFDRGDESLPDADLNIWLEADIGVRAARRCGQLALEGDHVPYEQVLQEMLDRERADSKNQLYAYGSQKGELSINNSNLGIEETYNLVANFINNR